MSGVGRVRIRAQATPNEDKRPTLCRLQLVFRLGPTITPFTILNCTALNDFPLMEKVFRVGVFN